MYEPAAHTQSGRAEVIAEMSNEPSVKRVTRALDGVDDPEYPGISVVDMGMIGAIEVSGGTVRVELIPTFSGCPALDFIKADIARAVLALGDVTEVSVKRCAVVWDTGRLSDRARRIMARDFTVAVAPPGPPNQGDAWLECPICGSASLEQRSAFGPTRCRAVHRCTVCGEVVEVLRA